MQSLISESAAATTSTKKRASGSGLVTRGLVSAAKAEVGGRSVAGHKGALWLVDCCLLIIQENRVEELHDWLRRRLTQQNRAPASKSVPGFILKKSRLGQSAGLNEKMNSVSI